jgi:type IV pilus assembly protein PilB
MQTAQKKNDLLSVLVDNNRITKDQAEDLKISSLNSGKPIQDLLISKKLVAPVDLTKAKAQILKIPFITLAKTAISPEVIQYLPEAVTRRYNVFPFNFDPKENRLSVAMEDPTNLQVISFIEKKTGFKVVPFFAVETDIKKAIESYYTKGISSDVIEAIKEAEVPAEKKKKKEEIEEVIKQAPIAKIVATLLEYAVNSRASDIHIEPMENKTRVRYRIDGIMHERLTLPRSVHAALVSRIKILSDMKIDERRVPQDGRFNFKVDKQEVDLRVSTLPTVYGEKVVMRLLKKTGGIPSLQELGLRGAALKNLEINILRPHGIILVTGPTGSGKTTTLYSVLSKLNATKINIMTLEDPVEYQIAGINQVQVNPQAGLKFASGLRSFLRQDPDIILVGEIRDSETAALAVQAALTGHLVFSTVHTNSAAGAIPRLLDMGVEPFLLSSSLNCLIGQRIVRRLCVNCAEEYTPPSEVIKDIENILGNLLKAGRPIKLKRGKGCSECGKSGYHGRIGIFEVLPILDKIANMVLEHASSGQIEKQAVEDGMITMKQDGYLKAVEGITSIEEVLRVAQD